MAELRKKLDEMHKENLDQHAELSRILEEISYSLNGVAGSPGLISRIGELEKFAKKNDTGDILKAVLISTASSGFTVGAFIVSKLMGWT